LTTSDPAADGRRPLGFWTIPNSLTMSRIPLGVIVLFQISTGFYLGAAIVFGIAAITDGLDGWAARKLGQASALGRQLDPLIDKLFVAAILITLLTVPGTGLSAWMVTIIVVRELLIQGIRSLIEGKGSAFGAKLSGKLKTTFQCLSIAAILLALSFQPAAGWLLLRDFFTWAAVGLTIYSGLIYVIAAYPTLKQ
jgi:CDP-diacylglycerol--glycerol-3-phosphate 3-phosphatidyltransferase